MILIKVFVLKKYFFHSVILFCVVNEKFCVGRNEAVSNILDSQPLSFLL